MCLTALSAFLCFKTANFLFVWKTFAFIKSLNSLDEVWIFGKILPKIITWTQVNILLCQESRCLDSRHLYRYRSVELINPVSMFGKGHLVWFIRWASDHRENGLFFKGLKVDPFVVTQLFNESLSKKLYNKKFLSRNLMYYSLQASQPFIVPQLH